MPPWLVDLIDAHLHAEAQRLAEAGQRAGQVLDGADHDFVLADAHLLGGDRRGAGADSCAASRATASFMFASWFSPRYGYCESITDLIAIHRLDQLGIFLAD
jgi:hypothetical protein